MNRRTFLAASPLLPAALASCGRKPKRSALPAQVQGILETIREQYRSTLLDDIVPFWEAHGVDRKRGGLMTCLTDDGVLMSDEKYTYSVARGLWTFSALYNRVEKRREWIDIARSTAAFLVEHGRDANGDWVYAMERDGRVKEGPVSIWSDTFACYGLIEYSRASKDARAFDIAVATLRRIRERTSRDDFDAIAPYKMTPGVITHGISMMEVVLSDEILRLIHPDAGSARVRGSVKRLPDIEDIHTSAVDRVMRCHLDPGGFLRENVRRDCSRMDTPEGRFVIPGHAVESMWKIMRSASRTGNETPRRLYPNAGDPVNALIAEAAEVMRRHLEAGWDKEYGGIYYSLDTSGAEPNLPDYPPWYLKMWWSHTEALLGIILAYELARVDWAVEWYPRLQEYAFSRYPTGNGKDWHERLTREGKVMTETVGLPVKDFFHTPRMCMLVMESIDRMLKG